MVFFPFALSALLHLGFVLQSRFPFAISSSPSRKISTMRGDDIMYSVSSAFALDAYILMRERVRRIYVHAQQKAHKVTKKSSNMQIFDRKSVRKV